MVLGLALVAGAALGACEGAAPSENAAPTGQASSRASGPTAFDRIVRPGSGRLPSSFKDLVTLLERRTRGVATFTFIPRGRSLVREATTLEDPRIVVAIQGVEPERLGAGDVDTDGTAIFLGFSRNARVVEVISYDATAGEYAFELVEDFGAEGASPRIRRAERELCVTCHKLGTPIFPVGLWGETLDHNPRLLEAARRAIGGESYEGFPLPEEAIEDFVGPGQSLEDAAVTSHQRLATNAIWQTTCAGSVDCRVDLLKFALYTRAELWRQGAPRRDLWPGYEAARDRFRLLTRERAGGVVSYGRPVITDRDPLVSPGIAPADDPILQQLGLGGIYRDEPGTDVFQAAASHQFVGGAFNEDDARRFREHLARAPGAGVVEKLDGLAAGPWRAMRWARDDGPLRRCAILAEILPEGAAGCAAVDDATLVPPSAEVSGGDDDADLAPFRAHCGACHGESASVPFLGAPPAGRTGRDVLRAWAHCIAPVLDWEAEGARRTMPPDGSARRRELDGLPEVRARMLGAVRVAAEEQRALAHAGRALTTASCPSAR